MRRAGRFGLAALACLFAYLAYLYLTLPDVRPLGSAPPATTAFIELRAREARARGETPGAGSAGCPTTGSSPNLTRAVAIAEDSRFWEHDGIDLEEMQDSIQVNLERGTFARGRAPSHSNSPRISICRPRRTRSGSCESCSSRGASEAELSKRRILEIYLNVIEWEDGIYGAEAAAREYFDTSAPRSDPLRRRCSPAPSSIPDG